MKRLKNIFNLKDNNVKKSDESVNNKFQCTEEGMKRFEKTLSYDHGFNTISYIEFGKWEIQKCRPNGMYVGTFSNGLKVIIRNGAYVKVSIYRKGRKLIDTFYLDTIDEAFYLMRGIVYGILD